MVRISGIFASVLLHALLLAALLRSAPQVEAAPPTLPDLQFVDLAAQGSLSESVDSAGECPPGGLYQGIGVTFGPDGVIFLAPEIYPGFQAGVRVGDRILNPDMKPDASGYETIAFLRKGKRHRLRIHTEWICRIT